MKKKIAILGSTGSIGKTSLEIFQKDSKNFNIILLSANSNYLNISKQIKKFKPKYFIIGNYSVFKKIQKKYKKKNINIYNKFSDLPNNIRFDITISAIVGIAGLQPTINFIGKSKKILLANKESIICGWHILKKKSETAKTDIIPIDSEHFSIFQLTKNCKDSDIKKIYITASGGPFLKTPIKNFKKIKASSALKHPNWNMGKKITIDSSNLMNKVFELIEAYKFFPFNSKKYEILIHPQSLIHAIVLFKNGQTKLLYHETNMKIPIANAIYNNKINIKNFFNSKKDFLYQLKNLIFEKVDKKRFPIVTLLSKKLHQNSASIILNASNEILVESFIQNKISYNDIYHSIKRVFKDRDFNKYAIKKNPDINGIYKIDNWAREKTKEIINKKYEKLFL
ncbi:MAG: 1-deoxy-D-xylulose-5-phosphate reductoisomerase [Candidatus Pelagibacter sp.]|nr:1-deoxy-D-xylulose-5-phosphate reductoisomerase [Candidatus Pelagibacter sp.]|tara:strand:- start:8811 stop:9998 length:1188 start_codon:yes stop_codon:yes gene_type:complete